MIISSSPTGGNFFFAAVKYFDANIAIFSNFVYNAKKSTYQINASPSKPYPETRIHLQFRTNGNGIQLTNMQKEDNNFLMLFFLWRIIHTAKVFLLHVSIDVTEIRTLMTLTR